MGRSKSDSRDTLSPTTVHPDFSTDNVTFGDDFLRIETGPYSFPENSTIFVTMTFILEPSTDYREFFGFGFSKRFWARSIYPWIGSPLIFGDSSKLFLSFKYSSNSPLSSFTVER